MHFLMDRRGKAFVVPALAIAATMTIARTQGQDAKVSVRCLDWAENHATEPLAGECLVPASGGTAGK